MSTELAVSILALVVALLSAVYARHAASEAKHANRIASHTHKLTILEAVRDFKHTFHTQGEAIDAMFFYALRLAADKASLYFTHTVATHLSQYAKAAFQVQIARDSARGLDTAGLDATKKWQEAFSLRYRCEEIEGRLLADLEAQTKIIE